MDIKGTSTIIGSMLLWLTASSLGCGSLAEVSSSHVNETTASTDATPPAGDRRSPTAAPPAPTPPPKLPFSIDTEIHLRDKVPRGFTVLTQRRVARIAWQSATNRFEITHHYSPSKIYFAKGKTLVRVGEYLFLHDQKTVYKLDAGLNPIAQKSFETASRPLRLEAMAAHGNGLLVSADGDLISLDVDLTELDREPLFINDKQKKSAHDILVHQGTAYLLDNFMKPFFVFKVDVRDPGSLQLITRLEDQGVNTHFADQWLDPATDRWFIHITFASIHGRGDYIAIVEQNEIAKAKNRLPQSVEIRAVSDTDPRWGLVHDKTANRYHLGVFSPDEVGFFTRARQVDFNAKRMRSTGGHLYLFDLPHKDRASHQLRIFTSDTPPQPVMTLTLHEERDTSIFDVLPG